MQSEIFYVPRHVGLFKMLPVKGKFIPVDININISIFEFRDYNEGALIVYDIPSFKLLCDNVFMIPMSIAPKRVTYELPKDSVVRIEIYGNYNYHIIENTVLSVSKFEVPDGVSKLLYPLHVDYTNNGITPSSLKVVDNQIHIITSCSCVDKKLSNNDIRGKLEYVDKFVENEMLTEIYDIALSVKPENIIRGCMLYIDNLLTTEKIICVYDKLTINIYVGNDMFISSGITYSGDLTYINIHHKLDKYKSIVIDSKDKEVIKYTINESNCYLVLPGRYNMTIKQHKNNGVGINVW